MTVLWYCSILQTVYILVVLSRGPGRHADWAAELSGLGSSPSFQGHSSDFVTRLDIHTSEAFFFRPILLFSYRSIYV